jgi:creatinine amidohydrolase
LAKVKEIDPLASHASWMENLPWTRLANVAMPTERKPMIDIEKYLRVDPAQKKMLIGDGNFGGMYQRPDEELMAMWDVAVDETRALIEGGWD